MTTENDSIPSSIAIVGRPNVGKSALFNRIAGRRLAIVHEESGVTRDRISAEARHEGRTFTLIDTGGIGMIDRVRTADAIETGTRSQVNAALHDAAVLVFVVDITVGILPLDEEVARLLHNSDRPVLVAANKADHDGLDDASAEFERFGFPVFPVSALHRRGVLELLDQAISLLPPTDAKAPADPLRIAVVGRPNVGKSSYINRILRNERVMVSDIPGTTRDSVEIPFSIGSGPTARHYLLVDTAGIRRAAKRGDAVERFSVNRSEKSIRNADVVVLMIDASRGPARQDKKIAALMMEAGCGCLLVVNKWDIALDQKITQRQYTPALRKELHFMDFVPVVYVSAVTGYNIRSSITMIDQTAEQARTKIATGPLNQVLRDAVTRTPPPTVRGKRLKIYYAVQVSALPTRIKLFINHKSCLTPAYEIYLTRRLRDKFGLEGTPIQFITSPHKGRKDA